MSGGRRHERLASQYPEPADVYICDKCARDITVHFYTPRAHVRQPIGPTRYICECGREFSSGSTEWDYLSKWDKRQWMMDVWLAFIFLGMLILYFSLTLYAIFHHRTTLWIVLIALLVLAIPLIPLFDAILRVPVDVALSIRRTRSQN